MTTARLLGVGLADPVSWRAVTWARGRGLVSAVRPEPVEVQVNGGRPSRFVWRGRLYSVLAVIERPSEPAAGAAGGEGVDAAERDHGVEWRCWRVTASPAKNVPAVAFRLCYNAAADRWQLTRNGG